MAIIVIIGIWLAVALAVGFGAGGMIRVGARDQGRR